MISTNVSRALKQIQTKILNLTLSTIIGLTGFAAAVPMFFSATASASVPVTRQVAATGGVDAGDCSATACLTIGYAISQSTSGDTINMAAGTYDIGATILTIDKSLTFTGPNAAISPNGGSRVAEAVIMADNSIGTFDINPVAVTVVFRGLDFQTDGAEMRSDAPGANITLQKNIFTGARADGMYFADPNLTVDDNLFTNYSTTGAETIQMGVSTFPRVGSISITNNTWSNITGNGALNSSNQSGTVSGNTFDGVEYYGILVANNADLTISNNVFNNITNPTVGPTGNQLTWGAGVRFYEANSGTVASVTDNVFSNSYLGVSVRATDSDITSADITVSDNTFTGNTLDILNAAVGTLNATNNYWGTAVPNFASIISGSVNYTPWYYDASMTITATSASLGGPNPSVTLGTVPQATIATSSGTVIVDIPAGLTITGPAGWDGAITLPAVTSAFTLTAATGNTATSLSAISIGAGDLHLTLDQPVKLTFTGLAGKLVGWSQAGVFHQITATCNSATTPTLAADADCKIDVGADLVVWTKHFTTFVTYTQTPTPLATTTTTTTTTAKAQTYTVQPGDTLFGIGTAVGVDWHLIASINNISAPYTIYPGQVLQLPASTVVVANQTTTSSSESASDEGATAVKADSTLNPTKAVPDILEAKTSVVSIAKNSGMKWYWWAVIALLVGLVVGYTVANRKAGSSSDH